VEKKPIKKKVILYSSLATIFGLLIPLFVASLELYYRGLPLNTTEIKNLVFTDYAFSVLFILPFLFFGLTYSIMNSFVKSSQTLSRMIFESKEKSEKIMHFTHLLQQGQTEINFQFDEGKDPIGEALEDLRNSLKKTKQEEAQRRKEDAQRHWANEGLAKFGELLRQNSENLEILSLEVILNLVNYLEAVQGGFYILQEDEKTQQKHYELMAHIAYGRRKYNPRILEENEGLVGRCGLEKKSIFLTDIPDNYLNVTSGLGDANPRCIMLIPLISNDEVHGVIELTSFTVFANYQLTFVEKLGESIAATIANVKINIKTSKLLKASQVQAEKLAKQEEEMRKNVEQLRRTQKEAAKQAEQFVSFTNSVNHTLIRAEYDINGNLLYANTKFLTKLGYSKNYEVEGRHISMFISPKDLNWFNKIWAGLAAGGKHFENYMKHVTKDGKDLWTMATYSCVRDANGNVEKILFLAIDTTEEKKQSLDYVGQIEALNRSSIKVEFNPDGSLIEANSKFLKALDSTKVEVRDRSVFHFIKKEDLKNFKEIWNSVVNGQPYDGQIKLLSSTQEEHWFQCTFSAVNDMYGDVAKVIFIANDISAQKLMEFQTQNQTQQLKSQEEQLRQSQIILSKKLEQARKEMKEQYDQIEHAKLRHEKTLEGTLDAVVTINSSGIVQFFNKAAEDLWGIPKNEVLGKSVRRLLPSKYKFVNDREIEDFLSINLNNWLNSRTEVSMENSMGEEVNILVTIAEAKVGSEVTYTAFIQNVSIELF